VDGRSSFAQGRSGLPRRSSHVAQLFSLGGFTHQTTKNMNWFKIKTQEGSTDYSYAGSSTHTLDQLVDQAMQGKYIRLDDLVYIVDGDVKEWASWDKRVMPSVVINPKTIINFMQYKTDPRTISK